MTANSVFPYPVGVLLFNRPEYARQVLESLASQTIPVNPATLYFSIDGFSGSKSEMRGATDHTATIAHLVREFFPDAHLLSAESNRGIPQSYVALETRMRKDNPKASWLGFFEEDYVLGVDYLRTILDLSDAAPDDIVMVSASGETLDPSHRGSDGVFPMGHLWAFLVRISHLDERFDAITVYRDAVALRPYWNRDRIRLATTLASIGVIPHGVGNDHSFLGLVYRYGRLAITTGKSYGRYIGVEGEHMTEKSFGRFSFEDETTSTLNVAALDLPGSLSTLHAQFHAGFALRMAERFVIPKFRRYEADQRILNASRWTRFRVYAGQAIRALFGRS